MKSIKYMLLSFLVAGAFTACTKDETETAGQADKENCWQVYVPTQKNTSGSLTVSPEDVPVLTYQIKRNRTEGEITVPILVEGDTEYFTISAIEFADGEDTTTFTVDFSVMQEGDSAKLKVSFDDPENDYVSLYSSNSIVDISLLVAGWIKVDADNVIDYYGEEFVGYCEYTDDVITTFFGVDNIPYPVEVEVRSDTYNPATLAGLYRMKNPYGEIYPYNDPGDYWDEDCYITINATNPNRVFIEQQLMGLDWGYGEFVIWSLADANGAQAKDEEFGTIKNGVITFPARTLLVAMLDYEGAGLYYANTNGAFRLVIDHTLAVEYDLTFSSENTENGKKPINIHFAKDVAKIKYAFYEGSLKAAEVSNHATAIDSGKEESEELEEEGTLTVEFENTGVYTLVAVVYDKEGNAVAYDSYEFGYVAAGEEEANAVVLTMGLDAVSSRYEPLGYTSENAAEFWAYGKDIEWAMWGIYQTSKIEEATEEDIIADLYAKAELDETAEEGAVKTYFTAEQLAALNGNGVSFLVGGDLISGTNYTVFVYAFNGYTKTLFSADYLTAGVSPDLTPLEMEWTADDLYGIEKSELFKPWYMWAVDFDDEDGITDRQPLSVVYFSESNEDFVDGYSITGGNVDAINIKGFSCGLTNNDTHLWEYYRGFILNYYRHNNLGVDSYYGYYINYVPYIPGLGSYGIGLDECFVGGLVDDGYMALVYGGFYSDIAPGEEPSGVSFNAYSDPYCNNRLGYFLRIYDIMFEDPSVSSLQSVQKPKNLTTVKELNTLASQMATPANFVELRGRERAHALIDELNSKKPSIKSATKRVAVADEMPAAHQVKATVTYSPRVAVDKQIAKHSIKETAVSFR